MTLSRRLEAICALAPRAECLADVGTDHGYVPIALVSEGKAQRAIAMDVNRGPLDRAKGHIRESGLEDRITTLLSDGLEELRKGQADLILIAGMGGALTERILERGMDLLTGETTLLLQPQSEIPAVRAALAAWGWRIESEDLVLEDGKFYPMMLFRRGKEDLTDLQKTYGPRLIEARHPVLGLYLDKEKRTLQGILNGLRKAGGTRAEERIREVEKRLERNRQARALLGEPGGGPGPRG